MIFKLKITIPVIVLLATFIDVSGQVVSQEYPLKAVIIEKITRFVSWPQESQLDDSLTNFRLYIYGKHDFGKVLRDIYAIQKIYNRKVEFKEINSVDEIDSCHMLYITSTKRNELDEIIRFTQNSPILTMSDAKGFCEKGVIINLLIIDNKIALEINETALHQSELSISYHLLSRAKIVNPVEP